MRKYLLFLLLALPFGVSAQTVRDFTASAGDRNRVVSGPAAGTKAIDLTSAAECRMPFAADSALSSMLDRASKGYTFGVWVRVPEGELQPGGGAVIATTADKNAKTGGFTIGAEDNGSWYAGFTDAKGNSLWYEPTLKRQPLNDGRWHLLALTCDRERNKAAFYYDGEQVAIYNLNDLGKIGSPGMLRLGGSDGTEWNAFNGLIGPGLADTVVWAPEKIYANFQSVDPKRPRLTDTFLPERRDDLRLMGFNIWHGGNETGAVAGPKRVADIIRESGAEVVGLIETYGSGAKIADELGYYFYLHSSNLSILSKYPIVGTVDFFRPFNCSAAKIQVSRTQTVNYINLWLHYLPDTRQQLLDKVSVDSIVRGEWTTRAAELKQILAEADSAGFISGSVPTFVSGDFNIDSHLDWVESTRAEHEGYVVPWPTSQLMEQAGFRDSYRELYPDPKAYPCKTWSPAYTPEENGFYYRIDFIFYKGPGVKVRESRMIDKHPVRFPSDHAAMLTVFRL